MKKNSLVLQWILLWQQIRVKEDESWINTGTLPECKEFVEHEG